MQKHIFYFCHRNVILYIVLQMVKFVYPVIKRIGSNQFNNNKETYFYWIITCLATIFELLTSYPNQMSNQLYFLYMMFFIFLLPPFHGAVFIFNYFAKILRIEPIKIKTPFHSILQKAKQYYQEQMTKFPSPSEESSPSGS